MPSQQDPSDIQTGPGKLPIDVATAATNLFAISSTSILNNLSNLSNREVAIATASGANTALSPLSSIALSTGGPFFVGENVSDSIDDLFKVVDGLTDQDIFNPQTQAYVTVTSISPATIGSGFYSSGTLTLNLSTPIPIGSTYKVFYGRRSTLGELPPDATTFPTIRRSPDRVRFPDYLRIGPEAPTSVAQPRDTQLAPPTGGYLDSQMAQWKAEMRGTIISVPPIPRYGGSSGFVNIGHKKNVDDANDRGLQGHQLAGFMSIFSKDIVGSGTLAGANPMTRINPALSASIINATTIELASGDFFRTATMTAIHVGIDMVEMTRANGQLETYIISALDTSNVRRATLRTIGGGPPTLTATEVINVRWLRPTFFVGGDGDVPPIYMSNPEKFLIQSMSNIASGPITDNPAVEIVQQPPFFGAARNTRTGADASRGYWDAIAFRWGGFNITDPTPSELGRRDINGELWGDGSVESYGGRIRGLYSRRADQLSISATQTYTWNPHNFSQVTFIANTASTAVVTIALDSAYTAQAGDEITFFLNYGTTGIATTFVYPATFKFSGADGSTPLVIGTVAKFVGTFSNGNFYFTRTDYL